MFYERYVEMCRKKNVSPSFAAEKAGFNKGTVTFWKRKYEVGEDVDPNQDVINKICAYFGCTEQEIRGIKENSQSMKTGNEDRDYILKYFAERATQEEIRAFTAFVKAKEGWNKDADFEK